jgi:hypothetical protein
VYTNTVMKIFIADTYLFGFEGLISMADLMVRVFLVVVWFKWVAGGDVLERGVGSMATRLVVANGLHLWDFVKGM